MRNWIKNGGRVALLAAGFAAVGSGIAHADTAGRESQALAAHQVRVPVHAADIGDCGSFGACDYGLLGLGVRAHVRLHLGLGLGLGPRYTGFCGSPTGYVPVTAANCCDTPSSLLLP